MSIYNKIVVASSDNELSQVTLPGFSICVRVPVIRGLNRFLTMAEVAEVEGGEVIIDTVWQFFMKRAKEANIIAKKKISLDAGLERKTACKVKREDLVNW